jgi:YidC/Oxa1 family membrane protein insertase
MDFLTEPLFQILLRFYEFTGNFGWAIIILTIAIRTVLLPLTLPAMKSQKKIKALAPQLEALKAKHKGDKAALNQAQLELYKENQVNPLAGCLPYLLQFVVLIALYQVLRRFIGEGANGAMENIMFFGIDLTQKDSRYILPILAAGFQLVLSFMLVPGAATRDIVPNESASKKVADVNTKEEGIQDMAAAMQKQMLFVMPIMTGVFAASFPAGLGLYWVVTTVFSIVQQWFTTGPGGLAKYIPGLKEKDITGEQIAQAVVTASQEPKGKGRKATSSKAKGQTKVKKTSSQEKSFAEAFLQSATATSPGVAQPIQPTKTKTKASKRQVPGKKKSKKKSK